MQHNSALAAWTLALLVVAAPLQGQSPQTPSPGFNGADWPMERLTLKDGRTFAGLILAVGEEAVEFEEIRRPRGKPMYLVIRPIERAEIVKVERLEPEERKRLEARIRRFRNRARIESGRMENVRLATTRVGDHQFLHYQGEWFSLESTADPQTTRRCIVRLEQMFVAFRQVLAPKRLPTDQTALRFRVYGTSDGYFQYLREQRLPILNPAYFDAEHNLVVAGSDVNRLGRDLAAVTDRHREAVAEYQQKQQEFAARWRELNDKLAQKGVSEKERRKIKLAAETKWKEQQTNFQRKLLAAGNRNKALLDGMLNQMLTRLYHEAFHAYLENYVYQGRRYRVPRWLNEGLAQIFEAGLLEADTLRVDAPQPEALKRLQSDLAGDAPLPLSQLLSADPGAFLVAHRSDRSVSARHYLYSWGLAYFLTFHRGLLAADSLDAYVSAASPTNSPERRFERLVGMPLADFEHLWRREMLNLKATPRRSNSTLP